MGSAESVVELAIQSFMKQEGVTSSSSPSEKGTAFCKWAVETLLPHVASDDVEQALAGGGGDDQIDALLEDDDTLYVVQGKYGSAHKWEALASFAAAIPQWKKGVKTSRSKRVLEFIEAVARNAKAEEPKALRALYVTSRTLNRADQAKAAVLLETHPELEIWDLSRLAKPEVERIPAKISGRTFQVPYLAKAGVLRHKDSAVVALPLASLADLVKEAEPLGLFASNVRNYSGPKTFPSRIEPSSRLQTVHMGIAATIQEHPDMFWYYNNGITLVCKNFEIGGKTLRVTGPQIVNGCQTSKVVRAVALKKAPGKIPGEVLVRVIRLPDQIDPITTFTNRQNAVKGKHRFSLDKDQRQLQSLFARLGYYYEIQEKQWANLDQASKDQFARTTEFSYLWDPPHAWIRAIDAIQAYVALAQSPAQAYAGGSSSLEPEDIEFAKDPHPYHLLFPYLLTKHAESKWGYGGRVKKGAGGKRHLRAKWLFTSVSYRLALAALSSPTEPRRYADIPPEILGEVLRSQTLCALLTEGADSVVRQFYMDSAVRAELARRTNTNFLTSGILAPPFVEILEQKIADYKESDAWEAVRDAATAAGLKDALRPETPKKTLKPDGPDGKPRRARKATPLKR